jgi:hypothetical protein
MTALRPVSLEELRKYPTMTSWFRPDLLAKLLLKAVLSDLFGQYADRRLIVAALDTVPNDEIFGRTKIDLPADDEGAVWVDFVADLGDGFDATYAIASLLAKESLDIGGHRTKRGKMLIMGGDEVYPVASRANYIARLRHPYGWALPDVEGSDEGIPVYCLPGNHDWYDGLVVFLALFARKEQLLHLGGSRSGQQRSYFALRLSEKWWIWCTDTQLDDDIDQPQRDYFVGVAQQMPEGSNIILCGPEPGWLYTAKSAAALEILDYAVGMATNVQRHHTVPIVLSGDTHHYSRYYDADTRTHFITSGGGGAFLHPTHQLRDSVDIRWLNRPTRLLLSTERSPDHPQTQKPTCYPSREESRSLLKSNLWFWKHNAGFSALLGVIYWIMAMVLTVRQRPDAHIICFLVLAGGMISYFGYQEGFRRYGVWISALLHAATHYAAIAALACGFQWVNAEVLGLEVPSWPWFFAMCLEMVPSGLLAGGFIFGLNLLITCRWFDMNHNDAFSAMRLDSHRHFLRIRIKDDEVTIFPIGLDQVPKRREWRSNPDWDGLDPAQPAYIAEQPLRPRLIEDPIIVRC